VDELSLASQIFEVFPIHQDGYLVGYVSFRSHLTHLPLHLGFLCPLHVSNSTFALNFCLAIRHKLKLWL